MTGRKEKKVSRMSKKILVAGLGKMGGTIASLLVRRGFEVHGYDPSAGLKLSDKIIRHGSLSDLVSQTGTVLLAVKPAQTADVISSIAGEKLLVSIAAGVSVAAMKSAARSSHRFIRAMPNTPFLVGKGATAIFADETVTGEDISLAEEIFSAGGIVMRVQAEKEMHAVTGLSGSGPAFAFEFIQSLEDAGVREGLSRSMARNLAIATVAGAAELLRRSGDSAAEKIHDVTSPGGTTIEGLFALRRAGFAGSVMEAVSAAAEKSRRLSP